MALRVTEGADLSHAARLDTPRARLPQRRTSRVTVSAQDGAACPGGLSGTRSCGWFLARVRGIAPRAKGQGPSRHPTEGGTAGTARDGQGLWRDTSSPAARDFCLPLGVTPCGGRALLPGQEPPGDRLWFLTAETATLQYRFSGMPDA